MGLCLCYSRSNIMYTFCNVPSKAFLEGQMAREKPTSNLAIKNLPFRFFFTSNHLFLYSIYSLKVQLQVISLNYLLHFSRKNDINGINGIHGI